MFKLKLTGLLLIAAIGAAVACSTGPAESGESGSTPDDVASFPTPLGGLSDPVEPQTADAEVGPDGSSKPTGKPPALDTSIASVPLGEVLFDTFQGGSIALSVASESDIDRLRDAIIPIYVPRYDGPDGGDWLDDDDVVLGYESGNGAYAYPVKMLNLHEIVNDVIDGGPVLISYCPLCASGVVYSRVLDGETLVFGNTSALYESDLIMFDWETGSYWHQVIDEAIVGPLTGRRVTALPSRMTTWSQ